MINYNLENLIKENYNYFLIPLLKLSLSLPIFLYPACITVSQIWISGGYSEIRRTRVVFKNGKWTDNESTLIIIIIWLMALLAAEAKGAYGIVYFLKIVLYSQNYHHVCCLEFPLY